MDVAIARHSSMSYNKASIPTVRRRTSSKAFIIIDVPFIYISVLLLVIVFSFCSASDKFRTSRIAAQHHDVGCVWSFFYTCMLHLSEHQYPCPRNQFFRSIPVQLCLIVSSRPPCSSSSIRSYYAQCPQSAQLPLCGPRHPRSVRSQTAYDLFPWHCYRQFRSIDVSCVVTESTCRNRCACSATSTSSLSFGRIRRSIILCTLYVSCYFLQ